MNSNSDPFFNQYADMDFTDAKRHSEIPALAQLQAEHGGNTLYFAIIMGEYPC